MDLLRIAGANLNQTPLDWDGNLRRILSLITTARSQAVQVLCFPELALTGYNCEDMFLSVHSARQALQGLESVVEASRDMTLIVGMPLYVRGSMYNCAVVIQNQKILGINPKKLLAREGVHYEARWFRPWPFGRVEHITVLGASVPFGDLSYQLGQLQLGVVICEEAWSGEGTASDASLSRCELVVNLSASHFALGKSKTRETLICDASRAFQVHYLYTNLLGLEGGRQIYDGEILLGECGKITARSSRFSLQEGQLLIRDIDLDLARVGKLKSRSVLDSTQTIEEGHAVNGSALVPVGAQTKAIAPSFMGQDVDIWASKELEFLQAEKIGLIDYLRKSHGRGFMISLSGGCDSSAIAVLCAHAIAEALRELGPEGLAQKMGWSLPEGDATAPKSWIREHVMTVYQATAQSGPITREAARALAAELGAEHKELSVEPMVRDYLHAAESAVGRQLSWEQDDLALQNIQARARAPMIWLLANIKGYLLLATSNRSEIAVGYATMDGDTAGGLSPLAGIDKHWLRHWLRWAEQACFHGLGPIRALRLVNEQEPTAELRPSASGQTDERDLMPYEILNCIETAFVRDRMEPTSILKLLAERFTTLPEETLRQYLNRFYRLWSRNQWKRERYAPGFHLDDYSLDPKSWCRFPILSTEVQI